ncbi:hypothetical protein JW960_03350 [candidate division KSB1 bacterium]|nr:hypothetical protein [candidate division KSB1 bacterium]
MTTTSSEINVDIGQWLNRGWDLIATELGNFILLTLVFLAINIAAVSTGIGIIFLLGPTSVGYFYIVLQKIRGKSVYIGDIAKGFHVFVASMLSAIVVYIFVMIGLFFLIIPGIIVMALYLFVFPLIIEKKMDFWTAMETSRKLVMKNLFEFSVFTLVLCIIGGVGALLFGVGLLLALPLIFSAIALAYVDMFGLENESAVK